MTLDEYSQVTCNYFNSRLVCDSKSACFWSSTGMGGGCSSYIDFNCSQLNQSQDCNDVPQCQWTSTGEGGACSNKGCRQFNDSENCSLNNNQCKWLDFGVGGGCMTFKEYSQVTCNYFTSSTTCDIKPACFWSSTGMRGGCGSYLSFNCSQLNQSEDCNDVPQCQWTSTGMIGSCSNLGCKQFEDIESCQYNQDQCVWLNFGIGSKCLSKQEFSQVNCGYFNDSETCKYNSCNWTTTGMRGACSSYLNFDCTQLSSSECYYIPQCIWSSLKKKCSNIGCAQFTDSKTCSFNQKCSWVSTDNGGSCSQIQQQM